MNTHSLNASPWDHVALSNMPYSDFLRTPYWRMVAAEVKKRDGHRCRVCNSADMLEAHHRDYTHRGYDHLHMDELITLCHPCHHLYHFEQGGKKRQKPAPRLPEKLAPVVPFQESRKDRRFWSRAARRLDMPESDLRKMDRATVKRMQQERKAQRRVERQTVADQNPPPNLVVGDPATVDSDMPEGDPIIITREILKKCQANGAYTSASIRALGLQPMKLISGWQNDFIGKPMSRAQLLSVMRGRHIYSKATFKMRRKADNKLAKLLEAAFPS